MKKLQLAALAAEFITLLVRGYHEVVSPLPDWTLRLNGIAMMAAVGLMVFASVRLLKNV